MTKVWVQMKKEKPQRARKTLSAYEQTLDEPARKASGVYYTPPDIVAYILERTLAEVNVLDNPYPRILDPACGNGVFLLASYDLLLDTFRQHIASLRRRYAHTEYLVVTGQQTIAFTGQEYWQEDNLHYHLLTHCIFGADSDAAALQLAAESLAAKSPGSDVVPALVLCDSLIKWEAQSELFAAEDRTGALCSFWRNQFDYVVGNPPYIAVTRMSPEQKSYYRQHYHCAEGRLNTFVLFVERAMEKASVKVGMIVPSRLLLNTQYDAIRRHILSRCKLQTVYEANEGVFSGAVVDTVVLIIKTGQADTTSGQISIERQYKGELHKELIGQEKFLASPGSCISFAAGRTETTVLEALAKLSVALGQIADVRDGIIQGAVGPELFLGSQLKPDPRCKPVLSGHMITPYSCQWQGEYIWYDPARLTELENARTVGRGRGLRLRNPAIFERPKILSRQTADHIIAAMDTQGYYYMNTLHGITITDPNFDPWYVLAVMNSEIIRCWYAWQFAETGRSFAQVKIANLKQLPVLCLEPAERGNIARFAQGMGLNQCEQPLLSQQTIDAILYRHSGLDDQSVQTMKHFAEKLGSKVRRKTREEDNANTIN